MGIVRYFFELNPAVMVNASNTFIVFAVVYFLLWLLSFFYDTAHFRKMPKVVILFFFFIKELLKANFRIAYDVITPKYRMVPGVVACPLEAKTDLEITMLASFLSLTPGSLTIDVSEDRKTLYLHTMYIKDNDLEKIKADVRNGFEKRILEITR